MIKSKSSIVASSIIVIQLLKGAQFSNAHGVGLLCAALMISPLTKM